MNPTYITPQSIVVADRQRTDVALDDAFLESIKERGIIQPIVVDQHGRLVAGGRRLAAALKLGLPSVPIVTRTIETDEDRELVELEENVRRRDLSWQDRCKAVARIHALRVLANRDEGWTQRQTGELIGESQGSVQYLLQLARELREHPDSEIAKADGYREAIRRMVAQRENEAQVELNRRLAQASKVATFATPLAEPSSRVIPVPAGPPTGPEEPTTIYLSSRLNEVDINKLPRTDYPDNWENVILVGPGTDIDSEGYLEIGRILKPTGLAFFERPFGNLRWLMDTLEVVQLNPYDTPVIWNKVNGRSTDEWPFKPNYTCLLYACKENPYFSTPQPTSVISVPPSGDGELPFGVVEFLLKNTTLQNQGVALIGYGPETAVNVAKLGRMPSVYEPVHTKLLAIREALEQHYRENVPGVVFA